MRIRRSLRTFLDPSLLAMAVILLLAVPPEHAGAQFAPVAESGHQPAKDADPRQPLFLNPMLFGSGATGTVDVAVADVNGDGKLDLVVANGCPPRSNSCGGDLHGYVGILLGNGDGTFRPPVVYDAGGVETYSVAVADINGDGKIDLVVSNTASDTVGVLIGNGDGTFQPVVTYDSGGAYPGKVVVVDVNGDGKPDILVANDADCYGCISIGWVGVLLGNGDGTFQRAAAYESGGFDGGNRPSLAVADLNGDGILDVAVTNQCGHESVCFGQSTVAVLLGNGDGSFGHALSYPTRARGTDFVAIADVNGDGKPDLIVANNNCLPTSCGALGSLSVLLGNGDGTFQPATTYSSGGDDPGDVVVADLNNDGKLDLVIANGYAASTGDYPGATPGVVAVLLGNGDGTFQSPSDFPSGGYSFSQGVAVADVNGDGKPDIIVTNLEGTPNLPPEGSVGVLLNNTQ
jgi:hypothetical protein